MAFIQCTNSAVTANISCDQSHSEGLKTVAVAINKDDVVVTYAAGANGAVNKNEVVSLTPVAGKKWIAIQAQGDIPVPTATSVQDPATLKVVETIQFNTGNAGAAFGAEVVAPLTANGARFIVVAQRQDNGGDKGDAGFRVFGTGDGIKFSYTEDINDQATNGCVQFIGVGNNGVKGGSYLFDTDYTKSKALFAALLAANVETA